MERLTERLNDELNGVWVKDHDYVSAAHKLAEYEDLEEQGKLLKLPCAVGDTVYVVDKYIDIRGVPVWRKDFGELRHRIIESKFRLKDIELMGKTIFLTYDEAEAALKEL